MLELIPLPFKRKIPLIFLQGLFVEHITICLIDVSSLGLVYRRRPDIFDDSIVHSYLGKTQFSINAPFYEYYTKFNC